MKTQNELYAELIALHIAGPCQGGYDLVNHPSKDYFTNLEHPSLDTIVCGVIKLQIISSFEVKLFCGEDCTTIKANHTLDVANYTQYLIERTIHYLIQHNDIIAGQIKDHVQEILKDTPSAHWTFLMPSEYTECMNNILNKSEWNLQVN